MTDLVARVRDLEATIARIKALHHRRPHSSNGGGPVGGGFDLVAFGQTEFPDLCDHCSRGFGVAYPCPTVRALSPGAVSTTTQPKEQP